jgi:hypothetical protein
MKGGLRPVAWLAILAGCAGMVSVWVLRQISKTAKPPAARTVKEALREIEPAAGDRLRKRFDEAGVAYPTSRVLFVAFKRERQMEVFADSGDGISKQVFSYPILGASGKEGPKLREGDLQVPEGFYRIELLNPNSRYHLSLRINYPSPADLRRAEQENRDTRTLGSDIMIHGKEASVGCLAMGDPAIEEIFLLAARVGLDHLELVIAPCDLRKSAPSPPPTAPAWTASLHEELRNFLNTLPSGPRHPQRPEENGR